MKRLALPQGNLCYPTNSISFHKWLLAGKGALLDQLWTILGGYIYVTELTQDDKTAGCLGMQLSLGPGLEFKDGSQETEQDCLVRHSLHSISCQCILNYQTDWEEKGAVNCFVLDSFYKTILPSSLGNASKWGDKFILLLHLKYLRLLSARMDSFSTAYLQHWPLKMFLQTL